LAEAHGSRGYEPIAAVAAIFDQVDREPSTEIYALNRSKDDPDVFWFYEPSTDLEAFRAPTAEAP
jgi:hypothetical protein